MALEKFKSILKESVTGDNIIYLITEKEHLDLLPDGTFKIVLTAELEVIKERFKQRMRGNLPLTLEKMLEAKHGIYDDLKCNLKLDSNYDIEEILKLDIDGVILPLKNLSVGSSFFMSLEEITSLKINKEKITPYDEIALTFIGFVTIIDPPRNETINAVKNCLNAGIKPIMLTGDYKNTAIAIAKDIGIYNSNDEVITGEELEKISQKELEEKIDKITVYARLNPNQKIRIVDAWQSKKAVVAMTGDGVNDALALAQSDVSIAMGNGTEVAKDASSMILVDNNFNTIVKAIENGRKIFINIQNAIRFLLSGNFAAILIVFITTFLKLPIP